MDILCGATDHLVSELHRHYFEETDRLCEAWHDNDGRLASGAIKFVHQCAFEYAVAKTLDGRYVPAVAGVEETLSGDLLVQLVIRVVPAVAALR
jgi:hypothetical protein